MNTKNRELLEQLAMNRLNKAIEENDNSTAFNEAMQAIDRLSKLDQLQVELDKEQLKQQFDLDKEASKQRFEKEVLNTKHNFENDMEEKRQAHELEKDENKFKAEAKRDSENRDLQRDMQCTQHEHELERDRLNNKHEMDKLTVEIEGNKKDKNKDLIMKAVEIGAAVIAAPLIEAGCKKAFAQMICEFEKDYNFTTLAGKGLSGLFRFKK